MAKWTSKRLEVIADELEAMINKAAEMGNGDIHYYLSEARDHIMDADDNIGNAGVYFA